MIITFRKNRDMNEQTTIKTISGRTRVALCLLLTTLMFVSCASIDPGKANIEFEKRLPEPKITNYTDALMKLGMMSTIYATETLKVQSIPIYDNTGSSVPTGGEIPKDISEMVKSALNCIGGNLIYIPYDPSYIQNQMITGYSNFQNKLIPDVVVSGGITEFDRGLETREKSTDFSSRFTDEGLPEYLPGLEEEVPYPTKEIDIRYGNQGKAGLARITLDFNLLNFQTMSGIPKINTVNTIEVQKVSSKKELGISIFAQAFGRQGKIKKVQGRHAAIRLLVELSMIQIIGRQLILPYWKLLGDDALPDRVVLETASAFYQSLDQNHKIAFTQQQLFLLGYNIPVNGAFDENTALALQNFFQTDTPQKAFDVDSFIKLWSSIPITKDTLNRRQLLDSVLQNEQENQASREQQQKPPSRSKPAEDMPKTKSSASEPIPKKPAVREAADQETVDQLLRMLEENKRKKQETANKKSINQLLKILEGKKSD
jgi:hypothetical protein